MKKTYFDTREMDNNCRQLYGLSQEIMMENAAAALEKHLLPFAFDGQKHFLQRPAVLILCGKGNNGADGYTLARRLMGEKLSVTVCEFDQPVTDIAKLQKQRAEKAGTIFIGPYDLDNYIEEKSFDLKVIVDCIFGSGFHGELPPEISYSLQSINRLHNYPDCPAMIACDIPSGMDLLGNVGTNTFIADLTVTMGALKTALFMDNGRDYCGQIILADLGISTMNFENLSAPEAMLLENEDAVIPQRKTFNVHKGNFGHTVLCMGQKPGAAIIAASAALETGSGLATIVEFKDSDKSIQFSMPMNLMTATDIPENTTALVLGPGFGRTDSKTMHNLFCRLENNPGIGLVLDADAFYYPETVEFLCTEQKNNSKRNIILTPHPKEFASLLELCGMGNYSVGDILKHKLELCKKFTEAFPNSTLLLKGTTTIICGMGKTYLYANGTPALAKAGSGDVLSGICGALLSQGYNGTKAACSGAIIHGSAACKAQSAAGNNYSLTPEKIIAAL